METRGIHACDDIRISSLVLVVFSQYEFKKPRNYRESSPYLLSYFLPSPLHSHLLGFLQCHHHLGAVVLVEGSQELGQEDPSEHLCKYSSSMYITVTSSASYSSITNWKQQPWWRDHKNWDRKTTTVHQWRAFWDPWLQYHRDESETNISENWKKIENKSWGVYLPLLLLFHIVHPNITRWACITINEK